jgi:hypothetical protein
MADFFYASVVNPSSSTFGVVFTPHDKTLYTMNVLLANSTHQSLSVKGSTVLDFEPGKLKAMKSKGGNRALLYKQTTEEFLIYNQDLSKLEKTVPVEQSSSFQDKEYKVLDILQQPISLVYHTQREIGLFKVAPKKSAASRKKNQLCSSKAIDIDQVIYSAQNPSVLLALSRKQNTIQLFELKDLQKEGGGKGMITCGVKGALRFGTESENLIQSIHIQDRSNTIYLTFANSQRIAVMYFSPKEMVHSILGQRVQAILD